MAGASAEKLNDLSNRIAALNDGGLAQVMTNIERPLRSIVGNRWHVPLDYFARTSDSTHALPEAPSCPALHRLS